MDRWGSLLGIMCGGALGTLARYLLSGWVQRGHGIPWGTATVNLIGCFLAGFLWEITKTRWVLSDGWRDALFIGVLGGLTTFSSYLLETHRLMDDQKFLIAGLNVLLQVALGMAALYLGVRLVRWI